MFFFVFFIGWYTFFLLYLWAKYELIWSNITARTVILGANLLLMAQTIPQNDHRVFFCLPKVAFTKDIYFWIWLRFLRYGFLAILKYVKILKMIKKMCLKNLNTKNNLKIIEFRVFYILLNLARPTITNSITKSIFKDVFFLNGPFLRYKKFPKRF